MHDPDRPLIETIALLGQAFTNNKQNELISKHTACNSIKQSMGL